MNETLNLPNCKWCDGVCYDQNVVNGTGDCDRQDTNIWFGLFIMQFGAFAAWFGIIVHVVVVASILKYLDNRSMRLLAGQFLSDIFLCVWGIVYATHASVTGHRISRGGSLGCHAEGIYITIAVTATYYTTSLVALERYRAICMPFRQEWDMRTWRRLYILCWIVSIAASGVIALFGGYGPSYTKYMCEPKYTPGNFLAFLIITSPVIMCMRYCYWKIYATVKKKFTSPQDYPSSVLTHEALHLCQSLFSPHNIRVCCSVVWNYG